MIDTGIETAGIFSSLAAEGYSVKFHGFSALDKYLELPALPFLWVQTNADISVLARLIENLRFPGTEVANGAVDTSEGTCYFHCLDSDEGKENNPSLSLLSFFYDWQKMRFYDPVGIYPLLRKLKGRKDLFLTEEDAAAVDAAAASMRIWPNQEAGRYRIIMECALFLSRYGFKMGITPNKKAGNRHPANDYDPGPEIRRALDLAFIPEFAEILEHCPHVPPPGYEIQRVFLSCLLVSPRPDIGLEFLKRYNFLRELWPELACFDDVDHSKEFHPEGNVWNHTLETFRHRKPGNNGAFDLCLSLGLLLHDAGKPISASFGSHRFEGHAELGARAAARFLERLEFEPSLVRDVFFLVNNHMLPAALKRLPLARTGEVMASPLFPALLELYRCDESSSFKGLDGYYENSAAYQSYLKNVRNPYRSADGKKIGRSAITRKM